MKQQKTNQRLPATLQFPLERITFYPNTKTQKIPKVLESFSQKTHKTRSQNQIQNHKQNHKNPDFSPGYPSKKTLKPCCFFGLNKRPQTKGFGKTPGETRVFGEPRGRLPPKLPRRLRGGGSYAVEELCTATGGVTVGGSDRKKWFLMEFLWVFYDFLNEFVWFSMISMIF